MTTGSITAYQDLCDLVTSVEHGHPRNLSLVERALETLRVFVPAEIANMVSFLLSAPDGYTDDGDVDHNEKLFCDDPKCPDKEDQDRVGQLGQWYNDGLVSANDADNIYHGRTL